MTIQRMDNVAIVVDDLDAAVAFFTELGMEVEGKAQIEGLGEVAQYESSFLLCYLRGHHRRPGRADRLT
jgi:catechol 2,3-dioxygenase-like lactoylglutathione lyase family enzyme